MVTSSLLGSSSRDNRNPQTKDKQDVVSLTFSVFQLLFDGDAHVFDLLYFSDGIVCMMRLLDSKDL